MMTTTEQSELLLSAVQQLMVLYQDICEKKPKLQMIDLSELKKMRIRKKF